MCRGTSLDVSGGAAHELSRGLGRHLFKTTFRWLLKFLNRHRYTTSPLKLLTCFWLRARGQCAIHHC